jgi:hypothetical protein
MWDKLVKALGLFPDAVLTWVDADGYPLSIRVQPEPDAATQTLRFAIPAGLDLQSGPASLLAHSHNEKLWALKSFLARGRLEEEGDSWAFRPLVFIPGPGVGSPREQIGPLFKTRSTARRYLARRGLPRPAIPWDKVKTTY